MSAVLVAVVEDDQSVLESLGSLLDSAGYEALLYPSAEKFLSADWSDVDCLISDIGLPGINGIELLRIARNRRPELPAIIITARGEPNLMKAALSAGARHVFLKPLNNADLLSAIAAMR